VHLVGLIMKKEVWRQLRSVESSLILISKMEVRNRVSGHDRFPAQRYLVNRWICVAGMNHIDSMGKWDWGLQGSVQTFTEAIASYLIKHKNVYKSKLGIKYRVTEMERSKFWEVVVSLIVKKKIHTNLCSLLNCYRDRAIWIWRSPFISSFHS
jgi:hypothetical protein